MGIERIAEVAGGAQKRCELGTPRRGDKVAIIAGKLAIRINPSQAVIDAFEEGYSCHAYYTNVAASVVRST